jgi:peptide/nickel transport system substrate-binding protein
LTTKQLDAAIVYQANAAKKAIASGLPHHDELELIGQAIFMNNAASSVLHDVRLREAVAKALDVQIMNQRIFQGAALPGSEPFPAGSRWNQPPDRSVAVDRERAKTLVSQVKQETGWDGTLKFNCYNGPDAVNYPTAIQSLLEPVGFKIQTKNDVDLATMIVDSYVNHDFDLLCFGISAPDPDPFEYLYEAFASEANSTNVIGFSDPEMDAVLTKLRTVADPGQQKVLYSQFTDIWNRTYPMVSLGPAQSMTVYQPGVQGIRYSISGTALFDQASFTA